MKRHLILIMALAISSISVSAQVTDYDQLLNKVKGGDLTVDFKALRFGFAEKTTPDSRVADLKLQTQMATLLNEKKFKDVLKIAETIHKTNFVDMNSHIMSAMAYQGLADAKKAKFHEAVYLGLVNSITKDADGNEPKTAYHVISVAEEYVLLNALELKRGSQAVESTGGSTYHVLTVTDPKNNESVKLYFNVDKAGVKPSINK